MTQRTLGLVCQGAVPQASVSKKKAKYTLTGAEYTVNRAGQPLILDWPIMAQKSTVRRCFACGEQGHLAATCPYVNCPHCGSLDHVGEACDFGADPNDLRPTSRFQFCRHGDCFVRRFIVPCNSVNVSFETGRVDVACRSTTAALFRSQSMRGNTEIRLSLQHGVEKRTVVINGGLVRYLKPDEESIKSRIQAGLRSSLGAEDKEEPHGVRCIDGGLAESLRECLVGEG